MQRAWAKTISAGNLKTAIGRAPARSPIPYGSTINTQAYIADPTGDLMLMGLDHAPQPARTTVGNWRVQMRDYQAAVKVDALANSWNLFSGLSSRLTTDTTTWAACAVREHHEQRKYHADNAARHEPKPARSAGRGDRRRVVQERRNDGRAFQVECNVPDGNPATSMLPADSTSERTVAFAAMYWCRLVPDSGSTISPEDVEIGAINGVDFTTMASGSSTPGQSRLVKLTTTWEADRPSLRYARERHSDDDRGRDARMAVRQPAAVLLTWLSVHRQQDGDLAAVESSDRAQRVHHLRVRKAVDGSVVACSDDRLRRQPSATVGNAGARRRRHEGARRDDYGGTLSADVATVTAGGASGANWFSLPSLASAQARQGCARITRRSAARPPIRRSTTARVRRGSASSSSAISYGTDGWFDGLLAHLKVYDRALSDVELQAEAGAAILPVDKPPIAYHCSAAARLEPR